MNGNRLEEIIREEDNDDDEHIGWAVKELILIL
jgi:hypothetical protein